MTTTTDTQSLTPDRKLELEQLAQQALAGDESVSLPPAELIALLAEVQHLRSEPASRSRTGQHQQGWRCRLIKACLRRAPQPPTKEPTPWQ